MVEAGRIGPLEVGAPRTPLIEGLGADRPLVIPPASIDSRLPLVDVGARLDLDLAAVLERPLVAEAEVVLFLDAAELEPTESREGDAPGDYSDYKLPVEILFSQQLLTCIPPLLMADEPLDGVGLPARLSLFGTVDVDVLPATLKLLGLAVAVAVPLLVGLAAALPFGLACSKLLLIPVVRRNMP